jgi:hypothetical protein
MHSARNCRHTWTVHTSPVPSSCSPVNANAVQADPTEDITLPNGADD